MDEKRAKLTVSSVVVGPTAPEPEPEPLSEQTPADTPTDAGPVVVNKDEPTLNDMIVALRMKMYADLPIGKNLDAALAMVDNVAAWVYYIQAHG